MEHFLQLSLLQKFQAPELIFLFELEYIGETIITPLGKYCSRKTLYFFIQKIFSADRFRCEVVCIGYYNA